MILYNLYQHLRRPQKPGVSWVVLFQVMHCYITSDCVSSLISSIAVLYFL